MNRLPLTGLTVLEFSQYLSGPSAGLRLADMGARVIKIERPQDGDACRRLAIKNLWAGDSSLLFHTINRNKDSVTADLKSPEDMELVKALIARADVLTHNFRPGIMEKAGLDYASVQQLNPRLIYGEISGYGKTGPWKNKPGQDLLLQSISGLAYTSGNAGDAPMPFGLSITDILCGAHLVQGILGCLIRRQKTGQGGLVSVSLLESALDLQFELLTTYYNSGQPPARSRISNGNPLLGAPYGIYATANGYLAIAMVNIQQLASALDCERLKAFTQEHAFSHRDEIKQLLAAHLLTQPAACWLEKLQAQDLWAAEVLDWRRITQHEAYQCLQMEQSFTTAAGQQVSTTRCPIRINGQRLFADKPAPQLGEGNERVRREISFTKI